MSIKLRFSSDAVRDIEEVLAHTQEQFGERQRERYKALIRDALADIGHDPEAPPAKRRPEIHRDARTFHLSRRGRHARHYFLYRIVESEGQRFVQIGRL